MQTPLYILFGFLIKHAVTYSVAPVSNQSFVKPYNCIWDSVNNRLLMGDYADGKFLCYVPGDNTIYTASAPGVTVPWFFLPLASCSTKCKTTVCNNDYKDMYATTVGHTVRIIKWDCKSPTATVVRDTFTVETNPVYALHQWHTAKASPQGHFYGGTLRQNLCGNSSEPIASGYTYSKCHGVKRLIGDQKIFGGFEWNAKGDKIYQINSCDMSVSKYDYNGKTGKVSNGQVIFRYQGNYGDPISFPIQLTVDLRENLYVTIYLGGVVLKISSITGEILEVIKIPGLVCAGITWGGANFDILYVSTFEKARHTYTGETINATYPGSGLIYAVTQLGEQGFARHKLCL